MSRKLDNASWEEYINKFNSYKGTITLKDFCIENKLSNSESLENLMLWSNKIPENMKIKDRK